MRIFGSSEVELFRVLKLRRVSVRRRDYADHHLALANLFATNFAIFDGGAIGQHHRSAVAQEFIHRGFDEARVVLQALAFARVAQQLDD